MRFDLRKPCAECPFTRSVNPFLSAERAAEIAEAVLSDNRTFTCHKHLNGTYVDLEDENADDEGLSYRYEPTMSDQHCAGAMAMVDRTGMPNAMLQVAERLGLRDPKRLSPESLDLVFTSVEEMRAHHGQEQLEE